MKTIERYRTMKTARSKKEVTYKNVSLRFTADLPSKILQIQRQLWDIVKKVKEMNASQKILYPTRLSLTFEGRIQSSGAIVQTQTQF